MILTRLFFGLVRRFFHIGSRRIKDYESRDAFLARFAPTALMLLPLIWATGVIIGFGYMFWAPACAL